MATPPDHSAFVDMHSLQLAFLDALERGELPDPWLTAYPEHAALFRALASSTLAPADPPSPADLAATAAILRATLQAQMARSQPTEPGLIARMAAQGQTVSTVAAALRLSPDILFKIDQRMIRLDTVPERLLQDLATLLDCARAALCAGLTGASPSPDAGSSTRPDRRQLTFAEAVQTSRTMDRADQTYWLTTHGVSGCPPDSSPTLPR